MTLLPDGGPALPVSVTTTRKVQGGAAIPVYGYMTAPTDGRPALGGSAIPVRVLTAADLKQNGGMWTLEGRPMAMPVYTAPAGVQVLGGPALAVYPVNAWPTVPVVPVWAPTDISGLALWLKADAGLYKDAAKAQPVTSDADAVYTWADQSGNGKDVVQATAGARPLYKVNIKNSKPVVRFDATDDFLRTAAGTTLNQPNTIFAVAIAPTLNFLTVIDDRAGATRNTVYLSGGGLGYWNISAGTTLAGSVDRSNTWSLLSAVFNGASSSLRYNGASEASGNAGTDALSLATIGANYLNGTNLGGDIGEVLVYNALLTAGQIAQVEAWLNTRWAVY